MVNINKMQELSISQLLSRYNFIIPEIQREYVWGQYKSQDSVINKFFNDLKEQFENSINSSKRTINVDENIDYWDIAQNILTKYNEQEPINIGFLYSYLPNYHSQSQIRQDVYLIDGQQRFTTLFIMLFFYALKENKKADFINMFRFDYGFNKIAFDYRVRNLTHTFILELIDKCYDFSDIENLQDKTWFLNDYKKDVTINSLLGTISLLETKYSNMPYGFFNFLSNKVKFWHFKTEATSQGEELYITMNSRGQSLVDYENIKAKLFEKEKNDKELFGKKWENWQDFFWEHKEDNENANYGFNEFLKWIGEIEKYKNPKENKEFNLYTIERYFKAFYFIVEKNRELKDSRNSQLPIYKDFIAQQENKQKAPLLTERKKVALYPVLLYLINLEDNLVVYNNVNFKYIVSENYEKTNIHSICRFFFNISRNSEAFTESIKLISNLTSNYDITQLLQYEEKFRNILTDETAFKLKLFKNPPENISRNDIENMFWEAEDHEFNSGKINHLIKVSEDNSNVFNFDKFSKYFSIFKNILPKEKQKIKSFLFYYGIYGKEDWLYEHKRISCNDWKYNVRSFEFLSFLKDFAHSDNNIDDFIKNIQQKFITEFENNDKKLKLHEQLFLLTIIAGDETIWYWGRDKRIVAANYNDSSIFSYDYYCIRDKLMWEKYNTIQKDYTVDKLVKTELIKRIKEQK